MDLLTLVKVVWGRWRVVVPILVVTFGLAYLIQSSSPPLYQADGYLLLESPEFAAADETGPAVDPVAISEDIELEGEGDREFTVTPLGGPNYAVAASALEEDEATEDAQSVVDRLARRIERLQEDGGVAPEERMVLRLSDPRILTEPRPDESWVATATVLLDDPSLSSINPYQANSSTGRLLQVWFQGDAAQAEFAQRTDGGVGVTVGQESRDTAPILQVVTVGADPEDVIDGFYVAQEVLAGELQQRQERADVLPSDQIRLAVLSVPIEVTDESSPVERMAVAVVALGGLLALGAALTTEVLDRRRKGVTGRTGNPIIDLLTPVSPPGAGDQPVAKARGHASADPEVADLSASFLPAPHPTASVPPAAPPPRPEAEPSENVQRPEQAPSREESRPGAAMSEGHADVAQPSARRAPTNGVLEEKLRAVLAQRSIPAAESTLPPEVVDDGSDEDAADGQRAPGYLSAVPDGGEPGDSRAPDPADHWGP